MRTTEKLLNETQTRWYVVANRTDTLFYVDGRDRHFHLISHLTNDDGRLSEGALDSDKPGRGFASAGGGLRHSLDRRFAQHEEVVKKFSHRIAEDLEQARVEHRFDELVLVAEPRLLGVLRESLSPETKKLVTREVGKEYVRSSELELRTQILAEMRLSA